MGFLDKLLGRDKHPDETAAVVNHEEQVAPTATAPPPPPAPAAAEAEAKNGADTI